MRLIDYLSVSEYFGVVRRKWVWTLESAKGKEFKDKNLNEIMATKRQLEVLEKARARKRQLKRLKEMREAKKKVAIKRRKSSSAGYKKAKKAIRNLKKYRP